MKQIALTKRQKEILDFIRAYRDEQGFSPTQREICERFGYSSFGTLQKHIKLLLEKGVLIRDWNKRRSLLIADQDEGSGGRGGGGNAGRGAGVLEVPLYGAIAAGSPIEVSTGTETVAVPELLMKRGRGSDKGADPSGENYVLRVRGNSMIDDGIQDGDYVVVHHRRKAENGEMVAALVNGEATLKRFYREADGRIRLQPSNERMSPLFAREDEVEVQGVVVGLMRRY